MMQIIDYFPVLMYLTFAWVWRLAFKEFNFNFHLILLGIAIPAHLAISALLTGNILINSLGVIAGILLYLILIFFMGGKASGETLIIIPATISLAPFPDAVVFVLVGIALVFLGSVFAMRKQMEDVKALIYDTATRSGMGNALPDYSDLPDRKDVTPDQKVLSIIPYMLMAMVIGALYTLFI